MHFKNTKVMQHLSVYLPIYLSICLSICLYVYVYITYIGRYPEILGRCCFKKLGKNNVSRSLLSQHLIGVPNIPGIHGAMYGGLTMRPLVGYRGKSQKLQLS